MAAERREQLRLVAARSLLALAIKHKEQCAGHCEISLFSLRATYSNLLERDLFREEEAVFQ